MQYYLIAIVLLLLIGIAGISLWLDGRQKRIDRQVTTALSTAHSMSTPSIRRSVVDSRQMLIHRLANYKPGIGYNWGPIFVLPAGAIAAAAVLYANSFVGVPPAYVSVAAVVVAIMVVRGLFGWQRRLLADKLFRQLPDTINMVTSAVRSGLPVNEAFRAIAREMAQPTAGQFALICSELDLGRPPEEAVEGVYQRTELAEYGFFAVTLAVQMKAGGGLAETLQTLGETVRERVMLAARAKALSAEVIFSARALTVLPFFAFGLFYLINPLIVDLLFTDPTGRKLVVYAVASILVGTLVIRWIIRRDLEI